MKLLKIALVAGGGYVGYRWLKNRQAGSTNALRLAFAQGASEVGSVLHQLGLWGATVVTPGTDQKQPVLVITLPPGVDYEAVAAELPTVAAGIPVQIVATPAV
jgi:hypothetical protein